MNEINIPQQKEKIVKVEKEIKRRPKNTGFILRETVLDILDKYKITEYDSALLIQSIFEIAKMCKRK